MVSILYTPSITFRTPRFLVFRSMSKMTFLDFNTHSEGSDWSSKSWIVCFSGIMCFLGHPFCRPVPSLFTLVDFFVSEIMSEMGVLDLEISGDAEAQIFPFSFPFFP